MLNNENKQNGNQKATADASPQGSASASSSPLPSLSLPKGGGAIRGIGEKFAANPVTGTGSLTVPISTSPGRSGFGPQLSLSYDSGTGNGPFGFGWSLSLPSITRKTDKGLPLYQDKEESDVYILSGNEDLVPVLNADGSRFKDDTTVPGYTIHRYRPRIEGLFARIERWTNNATGEIHWRSISRDNITTLYGKDNNARIFDPADAMPDHPMRIFSWLICESYDDKGNAIVYTYAEENDDNVDHARANERNRVRTANRYLKRIKYGNGIPNRDTTSWHATDPTQLPNDTWMFEVVLDYGEQHYTEEAPDAQGRIFVRSQVDPPAEAHWPIRQDPFSAYRAGFEVRTYRLCQRVLMFHHFPQELGIPDCLVRSTEFSYHESPIASFITSVTQSGYVRQPLPNQPNRYLKKFLPPLEFAYSQVPDANTFAQQPIRTVDAQSLENLPFGLDGASYQWVDLDGEGTSGILTEQTDGWYYKRNLSANNLVSEDGHQHTIAHFGTTEVVARMPSITGGGQFLDLAGDGKTDLVQMEGPLHGFYERTNDANWSPFQPFTSWPNLFTRDPDLRFVDLTGDGHTDILITEGETLVWYPSLAEEGFGPAVRVNLPLDEEKGPRLVFSDGVQSIYLADLSGDGLSDLVRIRNGEVSYWPNLGYGHFGARVAMDNAPWFDSHDQFDQRRVRLADTDGSGTTDILYFRRNGAQIYFNQSGNRWSDAVVLPQFPPIDTISSVQTLDLLGNGTACLVWSSPLPSAARLPMRYLVLMEEKPHLLIGVKNNLGAETKVHYAPSTKFYLDDKRDGKPWITRLPFPVHVVERVETHDYISRNHFVTRYIYHHGYFDGEEREFRGFGMVEQLDTEEFATLAEGGTLLEIANLDLASHVPPVLTRTWFHTGVYVGREHISNFFAGLLDPADKGEYYREPGLTDKEAQQLLLDDTVLPDGLAIQEQREACRALKGSMLRQETYALDGTGSAEYPYGHPYTVTEQNFTIRLIQPLAVNRHAVFLTHAREAISYHYERNPADPRIGHTLTMEVDGFGNVLKSATVGYGRREQILIRDEQGEVRQIPNPGLHQLDPQGQTRQTTTLITYTENGVTSVINSTSDYRLPLSAETRTYELAGYTPTGSANRFQTSDFVKPDPSDPGGQKRVHVFDSEINYEQQPSNGRQRRLIEQMRTLYRRDDLTGLLLLGDLQPLALPGESYKLAFTPGLLPQVFADRVTDTMLTDDGHYVHSAGDNNWWLPSGQVFYSSAKNDTSAQELVFARDHFFLPHRFRDPFGETITIAYDNHNLLPTHTTDPIDNVVQSQNDYRVMQPQLITDPNGNRSQVAFDGLGGVVASAVMGKISQNVGDSLTGFNKENPLQAEIDAFLANPRGAVAHDLLQQATTYIVYDPDRYRQSGQPVFAASIARETHVSDLLPNQQLEIQVSFSYSDGFGREIQRKIQAEPGPLAEGEPVVNPRWVGSGWAIFNNKGKPVRQYEPFFDDTHEFKFGQQVGVSQILFYDPVERVVATLHPNHTYAKVIFDPWQQETWDINDTVLMADPKADPDVGDFFRRLPNADYLPTWHSLRTDSANATAFAARYPDAVRRASETQAAQKTEIHSATPTVAYLDTLGRTFLTIAHNRFERDNSTVEEKYPTRVELDIEGNQRAVRDAIVQNGDLLGRIIMRYDYDMLSNRVHQASMEAGERWMLNDVTGKLIRAWNSRGHTFRSEYDPLRRPLRTFVTGINPIASNQELLTERLVYGEQHPEAELRNLRSRLYLHLDQAGAVTSEAHDFKGNPLHATRRIATEYKQALNWSAVNATLPTNTTALLDPATLEAALVLVVEDASKAYTSGTTYDALNRPVTLTTPHTPTMQPSTIHPAYNAANLLESVAVNLRGAVPATTFVRNIDYSAKAQRKRIEYGNSTLTEYRYDEETFRLIHLKTTRTNVPANEQIVQDMSYTYDPVGNITHIQDDADIQNVIFFRNKRVEPSADYTYDAIYRLIEATGREHLGQVGGVPIPHSYNDAPRVGLLHPVDGKAMGTYTERYVYDQVGNFLEMHHRGIGPSNPGWRRTYAYDEASLIEPGKQSNRLSRTTLGNGNPITERYAHDAHGNMVRMPHLGGAYPDPNIHWDYRDQLCQTDLGGGGTAYCTYDAAGQRIRKVWEKSANLVEERLYLGSFEIYRRRQGTEQLERETLHIMDNQQRIALVETRTIDTAGNDPAPQELMRYQFGNHLGSASLELDDQAQIISYEEYYPYGCTSYQAVGDQNETPKRYRYTGKERDEESGLYYQTTRYYAPWLGRWTATDRAGLVDGDNLYRYSRNNPINLNDPNGTDPPSATPPRGEYRIPFANPLTDPLAQASLFDFLPGTLGLGFRALDIGNRTSSKAGGIALRGLEFGITGLALYGPEVLSHELGGHVGAAYRYGSTSSLLDFRWFSGLSDAPNPSLSFEHNLAFIAAGVNQQTLNATATYLRVARSGYFNPQDAWAYLLGQAGTPAYALRTLASGNPADQDDINNYAKSGSPRWSTGAIAGGSAVTALPSLIALGWIGYQFVVNNRRTLEVPSLHIGSTRLAFPHLQTLLTSQGTVFGASTVLSLGRDRPAFQFGLDVRPTSDFALSIGARAYGLRIPGLGLDINPYARFTAANSPGIFGGVELGLNPFPWLGFNASIEGGVNDLRSETEGRAAGFRAQSGVAVRF